MSLASSMYVFRTPNLSGPRRPVSLPPPRMRAGPPPVGSVARVEADPAREEGAPVLADVPEVEDQAVFEEEVAFLGKKSANRSSWIWMSSTSTWPKSVFAVADAVTEGRTL